MKMMQGILAAAMLVACVAANAGWSAQNEQACDNNAAGQFKYYVLSLSWSPEFCRMRPDNNEPQCRQHREFIVHGLWPQCGTGNPQNCPDAGLADAIDKQKILPFLPSEFLIRHEWDTHGTCSGLARSAYFDLTGTLFGKVKMPRLTGTFKADQIEALFIKNNPGLNADGIYLSCARDEPGKGSNTLTEVRICFDKGTHAFTRCEEARDTCRNLKNITVIPAI